MSLLAPTLQAFFSDRMVNQKDASPRTIAAYRDGIRLLLQFANQKTGKSPSRLDIEDLDAPLIGAFLDHLEHQRHNSEHVRLDTGASVKVLGKRRKQRVAPLTPDTTTALRAWLTERQGENTDPVCPTRQGRPLSTKAVAWLLDKHTRTAARTCPSLASKRITPHTLRHTNAMLLLANNDIATVALWLGHETIRSTEVYLHADNKVKQKAIETIAPAGTPPGRYQPPDKLLAFLETL